MNGKYLSRFNFCMILLTIFIATSIVASCELLETDEQDITEIVVQNQTENDFEVQIDDQPNFLLEALQSYHYTNATPGKHSISVTALADAWTGTIEYLYVNEKETKTITLYTNIQGELVLTTNR